MSGWLEAFIVVATIAIVIQMAILLAMFVQMRVAMRQFMRIASDLQARIDPILVRVNRMLEDSEDRIASIMGDAAELTRLTRTQAQKVDRVFTDAADRLRDQIIRADRILTGALEVVEEAGSTFRRTLWQPFNQISAIIKGLKAGLDVIRGQKPRSSAEPATQDEELFI
jgi:5-hydroxyisourate hydrolase-like protein (transthyretin family)